MSNMDELIEILLDPSSGDAEKDDAAMELGKYTEKRVEEVLFVVSNDFGYNEMIRASCGESLAEIWVQRARVDFSKMDRLTEVALVEALSLIRRKRPDWYEEFKHRNPGKVSG